MTLLRRLVTACRAYRCRHGHHDRTALAPCYIQTTVYDEVSWPSYASAPAVGEQCVDCLRWLRVYGEAVPSTDCHPPVAPRRKA